MSNAKDKRPFTFEITDCAGGESLERVRRYLASIFPQKTPEAIERALERLPLRFRTLAAPDDAERLLRGLLSRGAQATLERKTETPLAEEKPPIEEPPPKPQPKEAPRERPSLFFWNAWVEALFSPRPFFSALHARGGSFRALMFAATLGLLAAVLTFPADTLRAFERGVVDTEGLAERYLVSIFTEPLWTVVGTCAIAWLLHMGLRLLAGPRPFEVTLKVVAYTTAAGVFAAIPKAGPMIAGIIALFLTLIGLSSAQRVSPIQAMGAVVFPLIFLAGLLLMTVGGLALGSFLILEALSS